MEMKILAQQLGISHQLGNRYKRRGMATDSLEAAQAWIRANINPFRSKTGRINGNSGMKPVSAEIAEDSSEIISSDMAELSREVNSTQLDLSTKNADVLFRNARALREKAAALQQAAEHEKFVGSLVEREHVERIVFERSRQFRDGLLSLSRRLAPELVGKDDISSIESKLNSEFRQILVQFSKLPVIE